MVSFMFKLFKTKFCTKSELTFLIDPLSIVFNILVINRVNGVMNWQKVVP